MKDYKIYTSIKILKKVWTILKQIGLQGLLSGGGQKKELDLQLLLEKLFQTDCINELCQIITKTDDDFQDIEIQQVGEIVTNFFMKLGKGFQGLKGVMKVQEVESQKE